MFTARRLRLIAFVALSALTFAQAAVAAMGCALMPASKAQVMMPSGEPCDMMPDQPNMPDPLCLKQCAQSDSQATQALQSLFADLPVLPLLAIGLPVAQHPLASLAHSRDLQHILGPSPLLVTQRFLI